MADRQQKIKELTEHIYQGLDLDFVRQTGSLFATSTLRHASTRQQFAFMKDFRCQYDGRLLTERVTNLVCTQLLEELNQAPKDAELHDGILFASRLIHAAFATGGFGCPVC